MTTSDNLCPGCGAPVDGRFCGNCGAPQSGRRCASCQAQLSTGARYCHRCGTQASGTGLGRVPLPLVAAGVLVVAAVSVWVLSSEWRPAGTPDMANAGNTRPGAAAAAPDISQLTPEQRFDRLYRRIMEAGSRGDQGAVADFAPMALAAYDMLPEPGPGARFQLGLIRLQLGQLDSAEVMADSILEAAPNHLLGQMLRGTVSRIAGDSAGTDAAYREFLGSWDSETASGRSEYQAEMPLLNQFREAALAATGTN